LQEKTAMGYHLFFITGIMTALVLLYRLLRFIYPYTRSSNLKQYLEADAYAVVTGATDGIGKAMAIALADQGFHLVLHGRNPDKLQAVQTIIQAAHPACKVVCLLQDGSKQSQMAISAIAHLPLKILVNNVGMGPIRQFEKLTPAEIDETITLNTAFPSQLTHRLLPLLRKPSLILNVSSYAGLFPPPYLAVYAGTKAYNNAFSVSLSRELEDVEVISLLTGSVNTGSNTKPVSFMRPSAATYARQVLARVGCGRKSIMPYWPHALQTFLISVLPEKMIDNATKRAMQAELK